DNPRVTAASCIPTVVCRLLVLYWLIPHHHQAAIGQRDHLRMFGFFADFTSYTKTFSLIRSAGKINSRRTTGSKPKCMQPLGCTCQCRTGMRTSVNHPIIITDPARSREAL